MVINLSKAVLTLHVRVLTSLSVDIVAEVYVLNDSIFMKSEFPTNKEKCFVFYLLSVYLLLN